MKHYKWETHHPAKRCGHGHCTDCKTRRGKNRGNRRQRYSAKKALKSMKKFWDNYYAEGQY